MRKDDKGSVQCGRYRLTNVNTKGTKVDHPVFQGLLRSQYGCTTRERFLLEMQMQNKNGNTTTETSSSIPTGPTDIFKRLLPNTTTT